MKRLFAGLLTLALLTFSASPMFSQSSTRRVAPAGADVVISVNVPGATVFFNNAQIPGPFPFTLKAPAGTYNIRAVAKGYQDYNSTVVVDAKGAQINIVMQPALAPVTFTTNAPGAVVSLGSQSFSIPATVQLAPGTYGVTVTAPGFQNLTTALTVSGAATVPLNLAPAQFDLVITVNVPGASVQFNNTRVPGPFPFTLKAPAGTYTLKATAKGYQDLTTTVAVNGPTTIPLNLIAATFPVTITSDAPGAVLSFGKDTLVLPTTLNLAAGNYPLTVTAPDYDAFTTNLQVVGAMTLPVSLTPTVAKMNTGDLVVFIDGVQQAPGTFDVRPGKHRVKIMLGARSLGEKDFVFKPKTTYDITVLLDFDISESGNSARVIPGNPPSRRP